MADRKKALLEKLEAYFKDDETIEEASIFSGEELGTPMEVLRLLMRDYGSAQMDILAEYSFLPVEGGDEVWFFSGILTILTEIPKEAVPALAGAVARLNFYLPYGSFCISDDGAMLIYKTVTALRSDHDDDKLYQDIELAAESSLLVPERYVSVLEQVAEGNLLLNDFLKLFKQ